jgi:hypothetical protein
VLKLDFDIAADDDCSENDKPTDGAVFLVTLRGHGSHTKGNREERSQHGKEKPFSGYLFAHDCAPFRQQGMPFTDPSISTDETVNLVQSAI